MSDMEGRDHYSDSITKMIVTGRVFLNGQKSFNL